MKNTICSLRSLLLIFALSFAFSAHAQTGVDINPVFKPDCEKRDYKYLNMITNIKRVSETLHEVVFTFDTAVVSCKDNELSYVAVNPELIHVGISKTGLGGLFGQSIVKEKHSATSEITKVTLHFNKDKAFETRDLQDRQFNMWYWPWGAGGRAPYFVWNVHLFKIDANNTRIAVQVR